MTLPFTWCHKFGTSLVLLPFIDLRVLSSVEMCWNRSSPSSKVEGVQMIVYNSTGISGKNIVKMPYFFLSSVALCKKKKKSGGRSTLRAKVISITITDTVVIFYWRGKKCNMPFFNWSCDCAGSCDKQAKCVGNILLSLWNNWDRLQQSF